MVAFTPVLATVAAFAAVAPAVQAATVNTPTGGLVQCQPGQITWTDADASGSVYLSVIKGKEISSTPLLSFAPQSGASGSLTWPKVNVSEGTEITLAINDATGKINYSDQTTILDGQDDCKLVNAASSSGSSSSGSSSGSSGSSGSSATQSSGPGSSGSKSSNSSTQTSGSSSSSNSNTSGATSVSASSAFSLLAGLAGVALGTLVLQG